MQTPITNNRVKALKGLFQAQTVAVVGGEEAQQALCQCDQLDFSGTIWGVNPNRESMEGRPCFRSIQDLPSAPDAAFIAVPRESTIEAVKQLSTMGTHGVVCYASGFAEVGTEGVVFQNRLVEAAGDMALVGPNCYGVLNYLDGLALWPDQQGGKRCERGVAIISQSGNISINFTMQRRGVPIAYLISTGNMSGAKIHDYIFGMLDDPRVTAIGLYLEGFSDVAALSEAVLAALQQKVPVVVLESGHSKIGAAVTRSHSSSLSSKKELSRAFYDRYGVTSVDSIPQFLETLKFLSIISPLQDKSIATISCSGGEAALMADLADKYGLDFAPFTDEQKQKLHNVLGDRVVVANPLDYHTYIWGNGEEQKKCFQAVFEGSQSITVKAFDYPNADACDSSSWDRALDAVVKSKSATEANVAVVSSMHENTSELMQNLLIEHGIAPMLGMDECFRAIVMSAHFGLKYRAVNEIGVLPPLPKRIMGSVVGQTEYQSKQDLLKFGVPVVQGREVLGSGDAEKVASEIGFPVAVKGSSTEIIHKTDANAVHLNLNTEEEVRFAVKSMEGLVDRFLVESMAPSPYLEMFIGVRYDEIFGFVLIIGAGGTLVELVQDSAVLIFPFDRSDIVQAIAKLKIGKLLKGYRGSTGDTNAIVQVVESIVLYVENNADSLVELDLNPLYVYQGNGGAIAVDAYIQRIESK